jgi:hypothetical protein
MIRVQAGLRKEPSGTLALRGLSVEDLGAFTDVFVIYSSRKEGLGKVS